MKKMKSRRDNFSNKIKKSFKGFINDPIAVLIELLRDIKMYVSTNIFFCLYVLFNVVNGILVRYFTTGNSNNLIAIQPFLADIAIVTLFGSLGYLMRHRLRMCYWYFLTLIFSMICVINSVYYTFYSSYVSVSLLSTAKYGEDVSDAIIDILELKDFCYLLVPIVLLVLFFKLSKKKYFSNVETTNKDRKKCLSTMLLGCVIAAIFASTLTSTDLSRISKQWNREYIVIKYGIYVYQANDIIKSVEPKISALFGYDEALRKFHDYFKNKPDEAQKNKYSNILEGRNVIVIHAESIQDFVIGYEINDELVAPNLTKLANSGIYFNNFYTQVSVGTSSDSEFTFNTGLMPSNSGTAFVSYFDRTYFSMPKLLKEKGYYASSFHGNVASYWNRSVMHKSLGYDDIVGKSKYEIDETIGLGLSDKSFLRQTVEKLEKVKEEKGRFYATVITLTNHTPFYVEDGYDVTLKVKEKNKDGEEVINTYPYMENTKLGRYLKSVHYADEALGEFIEALDSKGLLDNAVIVLYGDHDARLPKQDYVRLYNYDYTTDSIYEKDDPHYVEFDSYSYELNRKTPFIIWTKEKKIKGVSMNKKIDTVMGMYDALPTLGNMLGVYNKYALGHDMFSLKEKDNLVVFPTGNWLTNKVYYNAQKNETYMIEQTVLPDDYVDSRIEYAEKLLSTSNNIVVYNLLESVDDKEKDDLDESKVIEGAK